MPCWLLKTFKQGPPQTGVKSEDTKIISHKRIAKVTHISNSDFVPGTSCTKGECPTTFWDLSKVFHVSDVLSITKKRIGKYPKLKLTEILLFQGMFHLSMFVGKVFRIPYNSFYTMMEEPWRGIFDIKIFHL